MFGHASGGLRSRVSGTKATPSPRCPRTWRRSSAASGKSGQRRRRRARHQDRARGRCRVFELHSEWDVVALRCASALSAGPVDDAVFERYATELRDGLLAGKTNGGWDAVYLCLHGAAITPSRQTPDLDLVRLVRSLLPDVPLGASFDLHGNMAAELGELLDVASCYRTHPHVDMKATATRVLDALIRCAEGSLQTRCVVRNEGVLLGSFNMRTDAGPMCDLQDRRARGNRGRHP